MHRLQRALLAFATSIGALALAVSGLALTTASPASAQVTQPLDHFLCSTTTPTGPPFMPVPGTMLIDQFAPNGFVPAVAPTPVLHCNPTVKLINGQVVSVPQNPQAHLLCLPLKAPKQLSFTVAVENQFGQGTLTAKTPKDLCLPSWKTLTGPPNMPVPQPPGLFHFTCYPVKYAPGSTARFAAPGQVSVQDEFATAPVNIKVGSPKLLCLPTTKILPTGLVYPADLSGLHLLCFSVSRTPVISPVFDQNQFGQAPVNIVKTKYLCLPSTKQVLTPAKHHKR